MTRLLQPILVVCLSLTGAAVARAQNEAPPPAAPAAPAADNALAGVPLKKYELDRSNKKDDPVQAGRRFLEDLKAASPAVWASVVDAVRSDIQADETKRFARQNGFVMWAYGAAWALIAGLAVAMLLRQRKLAADLAALEARVKVEK